MNSGTWCARWLALVGLVVASTAQATESPGQVIEVSALSAGGPRRVLARVDLDQLPQSESRRYDPQYDASVRLRGVSLEQLLGRVSPPASLDVAILRFNNGLAIPLAFRDSALMGRLHPFVARAATLDPLAALGAGRVEDPRRPPTVDDLRPVHFAGNKIVVAELYHPDVLSTLAKDLRPWLYADSLATIELVERAAWERQLDVDPATTAGLRVYLGSCRFCHAVRGTGGALGWDFVDPYPIYSEEWLRRMGKGASEMNPTPGRTLLGIHVRYRPEGAGRSMPALRAMRREEIEALWSWLQAVAARPLRPYGTPAR